MKIYKVICSNPAVGELFFKTKELAEKNIVNQLNSWLNFVSYNWEKANNGSLWILWRTENNLSEKYFTLEIVEINVAEADLK